MEEPVKVLAIETSCDETAAAVVEDGRHVLSSVVSSQTDIHSAFGGVVPEIASRAHLELLGPVVSEAMARAGTGPQDLAAVAATVGPGLVGSLIVGVSAAKAYAWSWGLPFVGVNHMEGHLHAAFLEDPALSLPTVVLLVSGGHTMLISMQGSAGQVEYRLLGQTIDDAAGEAFDKVARFLGLGYPGGPAIERAAREGDPSAIAFPRGLADERVRFFVQRPEDFGRPLHEGEPGRRVGRCGSELPGGGCRRPRHQDEEGRGRGPGQSDLHRRRCGGEHVTSRAGKTDVRGRWPRGLYTFACDVHR